MISILREAQSPSSESFEWSSTSLSNVFDSLGVLFNLNKLKHANLQDVQTSSEGLKSIVWEGLSALFNLPMTPALVFIIHL